MTSSFGSLRLGGGPTSSAGRDLRGVVEGGVRTCRRRWVLAEVLSEAWKVERRRVLDEVSEAWKVE